MLGTRRPHGDLGATKGGQTARNLNHHIIIYYITVILSRKKKCSTFYPHHHSKHPKQNTPKRSTHGTAVQKSHLLGDFWESKGSPRSSNLPSSLKLSSDGDLKVLIASNSSEKSKGFFLGQLCNLSGIFFLDQRSIADPRKGRSLVFCIRGYQVGLTI